MRDPSRIYLNRQRAIIPQLPLCNSNFRPRRLRKNMKGRVDFHAELILVCNSLAAGGIERVVSTLANEWSRRGRKVSVVTLHDRHRFYRLDPSVHHVVVEKVGNTWLPRLLRKGRSYLIQLGRLKPALLALLGSCEPSNWRWCRTGSNSRMEMVIAWRQSPRRWC